MSKTQGPESQVGGSVGDSAQTVLNGVDGLVHKRLTELKLQSHDGRAMMGGGEVGRDRRERQNRSKKGRKKKQ